MSIGTAQVVDGLWQYMCPSFSRFLYPQVQKSSHTKRPIYLSKLHKSQLLPHRSLSSITLKKQQHDTQLDTPNRLQRPKASKILGKNGDLTDYAAIPLVDLNKQLWKVAEKGDLKSTKALLQVIIHDHGERPNETHYHALILANTDASLGSASEVERLLEEMKKERLPVDSNVCRAVLKVNAFPNMYFFSNIFRC
jgi:hypothetical protein